MAAAVGEAIAPLAEAGKLGPLTFQFPLSYRNTDEHRDEPADSVTLSGILQSARAGSREWLSKCRALST